jgi:hypothetical protein
MAADIESLEKEIERLQEAKRRALAIADERSKENVRLRKALADLYAFCKDLNDFRPDSRLGREVRAVLGDVGSPST